MSIKHRKIEEPNPLNFYGIRQVRIPPPHFEYMDLNIRLYNLEQTITKWIIENLKGRFYVDNITTLDHDNQYQKIIRVGFEDSKELSFFTLACPHLKYK
jgi:hypothetical protein